MSNLLHCLKSVTNKIDLICRFIPVRGVCGFTHDITFGKGEISILTNRHDILSFYYKHAFPVTFTTDEGRTLAPGIYLTQNLASFDDYQKINSILTQKFKFIYAIHILERERDCQHLYTFYFNLNEQDFLHVAINNIGRLKAFIREYKVCAEEIINNAALPKNRITLPFGKNVDKEISTLSSELSFDQLQEESSMIIHKDTNISVLVTARQKTCFKLLSEGYATKEIASRLALSPRTVEHYLESLRKKLNCRSSKEMMVSYRIQDI